MDSTPLAIDRYRDLLGPILGAQDLFQLRGATVVDLSADHDSPYTLAFLLLGLGAERAYVVSEHPIPDPARAVRDLATAAAWLVSEAARLLDRPGLSPRTLAERLDGFDLDLLARGDERGLAPARLVHLVSEAGEWPLPDGAADLVVSFSLLEHVDPDVALPALLRATAPGGVGIHLVDLVDHRVYAGTVSSPDAFLAEPEGEALVHGANRLRVSQWVGAFRRQGFQVDRVEKWSNHAAPDASETAAFCEPFRSMAADELAITGARLFVHRAGAPAASGMHRPAPAVRQRAIPGGAGASGLDGVEPDAAREAYAGWLATAKGQRATDFVALEDATVVDGEPLVQVVAFYLPQFHPIPENDAWWGRGFTEWTNVSKASPQFVGHDQPRLPGELGFYDLRVPDVQRRQVALARQFGVSAFCFYYYWFGGRRVLERPLEQFMADDAIDFPFCVCWANEHWTRRWDGHEDEVLLEQAHSPERDAAFIVDVEPALAHPRYLRIDGRPVLLVYRAGLLKEPAATVARWREHRRRAGLPDLFLVATDSFETLDPTTVGFDAAVEFPPNSGGRPLPLPITGTRTLVNLDYAGTVYRYRDMWRWRLDRPAPPYTLFRSACAGFDNEARRPGAGATYFGATAAAYGRWLMAACRTTLAEPRRDRRLVFVNAWNEWAEAAYLEPDRRHGYAHLARTAAAVNALRADWTLLVVSHDACRGGAQLVLLEQLAWLRRHTAIRCAVLCLTGGEWLPRFEALADTMLLTDLEAAAAATGEDDLTGALLDLCGETPALVLANSVASGRALRAVAALGAPIVTQVHELASSIARYASEWMPDVLASSAHFIACAEPVRQALVAAHGVAPASVTTVPASIVPRPELAPLAAGDRGAARAALGLPDTRFLVAGSGIGMPFRKGADLFLQVAREIVARGRHKDVSLVWAGGFPDDERDPDLGRWGDVLAAAEAEGLPVTFTGVREDVAPYLRAADVLLLPSREDPFPLVVLEAGLCGVPVVCFAGAGGMPDVVGAGAGVVVPHADVEAMTTAALALLDDAERRRALGEAARALVTARYTVDATAPALLAACRRVAGRAPTVSVIVPNYNHARYLPQRLDTIVGQSFRDVEILVLDDASTDDSLAVLAPYRARADLRVLENATNSGSTFVQWLRGLDEARGDFIWIAESDDGSAPDFLETMVRLLRDPQVRVAYANSHVWDERSEVVGDYTSTPYLRDLSSSKWLSPYCVPAGQEVRDGFGVKNTILSASAVVFRRFDLDPSTRAALPGMRIAGDWRFFAEAMRGGDVAYSPRKLNYHRRHGESVVGRLLAERRVEEFFREIASVQRWIVEQYGLDEVFAARWDACLREQWETLAPGRPFAELAQVYPVDEMRARIAAAVGRPEPA
ncbi:MAG: glycoside hydrolase family 99-like domain-containing protein [Vicinamibacterales bacterium]